MATYVWQYIHSNLQCQRGEGITGDSANFPETWMAIAVANDQTRRGSRGFQAQLRESGCSRSEMDGR